MYIIYVNNTFLLACVFGLLCYGRTDDDGRMATDGRTDGDGRMATDGRMDFSFS